MLVPWICLLVYGVNSQFQTPVFVRHSEESSDNTDSQTDNDVPLEEMHNLAAFDDAEHRGKKWYDSVGESTSALLRDSESSTSDDESFDDTDESSTEDKSTSVSSVETKEKKRKTRKYRQCTPCPQDLLKKKTNIGIKWICGGYQRARRTFKSPCMMRYRNCQDGTLFVQVSEHRCKNDTFHGRHWFYIYRV